MDKTSKKQWNPVQTYVLAGLCIILIAVILMAWKTVEYRNYLEIKKQVMVLEGESPVSSNYTDGRGSFVRNKDYLGGISLELSTQDEIPGGYFATYSFDIFKDGDYNIIIAGTPPGPMEKGSAWHSPYSITLDNQITKDLYEEDVAKDWLAFAKFPYSPGGYYFTKVMTVPLAAGKHEITVTINKRRQQDGRFAMYLDAILITPKGLKTKRDIGQMPRFLFDACE